MKRRRVKLWGWIEKQKGKRRQSSWTIVAIEPM